MKDLRGKVALVTGAGSGIGRETARALASAGARLVLCDVDREGLASSAQNVSVISDCILAERVDVSRRAEMEAFASKVHRQVPALDILVNNAGVGLAGGVLHTSLDDWEWVLGVNLWGVIHGCHFFLPPMVQRGGGHVVNVSSALGYLGAPDVIGYVTSKFGVLGLSESLRAELGPRGIEVSTICPGVVATGIIQRGRFRGFGEQDAVRERVDQRYRKRNYGPERVAKAIVGAIRSGGGVVPVSPEAWLLYYVKRFAPPLAVRLGRMLSSQSLK